jgi:hypothetical protein
MKTYGVVLLFVLACGTQPSPGEITSRSSEQLVAGAGGMGAGGMGFGGRGSCALGLGEFRYATLFDDPLDYDGERDTFLGKGAPTHNFSSFPGLNVTGDPTGSGVEQVSLLHWDLPSYINPADTVCLAAIQLYVTDPASNYEVYTVKRPWIFDQAAWNLASTTDAWEVPGAQGASDRGPLIGHLNAPSANATVSISIPGSIVQGWLSDPTKNNGVLIADHSNPDRLVVTNHNGSNSVNRPRLVLAIVGP